jgi:ribonuclease Y
MGPLTLVLAASSDGAVLVLFVLAIVAAICGTFAFLHYFGKAKRAAAEQEIQRMLAEAKREAGQLLKQAELDAKAEYIKRTEQFERETAETRNELRDAERRLAKREDNLEGKLETLATKERGLEQAQKQVRDREKKVEARDQELREVVAQQRSQLLKISGMSVDEARDLLLTRLSEEMEKEAAELIERTITDARETAEKKSREIVVTAIQRYAAEHTCDSSVSTVDIPNDDMKGRVIGREGRNIRAFEKATGVDVIVDDTPGVVVVSAFDPVRREVARQALERLVQDGRIHPARIEEVVEETKRQVEKDILELGRKAAMDANVSGLHRKQLDLLGRLHYRTSYGQNVLRHSVEVAYLCQTMADELGLDGSLARRCGLLHDIGKAVDHEVEGGHPSIGADICKRFGESPEVLNAIEGHHNDIQAASLYTPLVAAADAISAARPGGRRESLERYIKRLQQLEELATEFKGVKQAYAIQAGREIRVLVDADSVDDGLSYKMAREIAKRIESEMTYPGEVKVTLIREVRAVDYAR